MRIMSAVDKSQFIDHRGYINSRYEHPVNVRSAVAAMEQRISKVEKKPKVTKPAVRDVTSNDVNVRDVVSRNVKPPDRPLSRKGRHRRSMSDPNLHKTFSQVKLLWDAKAETDKRVYTPSSRAGSVSSVSSVGSNSSRKSSSNFVSCEDISDSKKRPKPPEASGSRKPLPATKVFVTSPKPSVSSQSTSVVTQRRSVTSLCKSSKTPETKVTSSDQKKILTSSGSSKLTSSSEKNKLSTNRQGRPGSSPSKNARRVNERHNQKTKRSVTSSNVPEISVQPTEGDKESISWVKRKLSSNSSSGDTSSVTSPKKMTSPGKSSMVSERALVFGGAGKVTFPKPRSNPPSPPFQRRILASESSTGQSVDTTDSSDVTENIYDEIDKVDEGVAKLQATACSQDDDVKLLVSSLEKKANMARERRLKKQGSFDSASEDDQTERRESFLRRNSSAASRPVTKQPSTSGKSSPFSIVHTEASIFGVSPESSSYGDSDDDVSKAIGRRRASSLHRMFDDKLTKGTSSTPGSPASTSRKNSMNTQSPLLRPNQLDLMQRQRSKTEGDRITNLVTGDNKERSNSLGRLTPCEGNMTPPQINTPQLPPKPRPGSDGSSASTGSDVSGFNLLAEYDKIAQEITLEGQQSSSGGRDSGISVCRDSLAVPTSMSDRESWSDFDNSDDCEEGSVGSPEKVANEPTAVRPATPPPPPKKESTETKLHKIAKELLSTEESYVAVLHIIDQVFHKRVMEEATNKNIMPENAVNSIFSHVSAIYQFHHTFLLPQLKDRLANWESDPRISDIMCRAAPFLKMYGLYVQNFDEAMNMIKAWSVKSSGFNAIIKSIQKLPECKSLTLQHHMLGPVQRIPRYQMLLQDYVKRMAEDSPDRPDTENALKLITVAATHSNETMKKMEKFHKLVNVFNKLADVNFDIVDVSREMLKEGKIVKISARNGEKYERYLYLFSDMLLCCTPLGRLQGKSYKVTAKMDIEGMKVTEVKNPTSPHAFCVEGRQKSTEFAASTQEEKDAWVSSIEDAILQSIERRKTFDLDRTTPVTAAPKEDLTSPTPVMASHPFIDIEDADLGTRAPRWIKDNEVTMCMCCSKKFSNLIRRRHHCRACGRVVCSECSEHKSSLQYDSSKPLRVCSNCYNVLTGREQHDSTDGEKKGVLEVEADIVSEHSVLSNYLYFTENEKKRTWTKTWCVIPDNELCLYFYGALQDVRAQMTMPLPGYDVTSFTCHEHKFCFKLNQARKVHLFAADTKELRDRWMYALKQASVGEDLDRDDVLRLGKQPVVPHVMEEQNLHNGNEDSCSSSGEFED
uniref:zinc finger protein isoform X2 n=1 Tax=Ciona intestinalis TaxID=7719 RepID=UPI00089DAA3B|nr:zinc finger protein isoform X2 [Ciona intestinalis]|eukprot:XP_018667889.1 zinc finger protein isoform X2 [Ciona intestinalis]